MTKNILIALAFAALPVLAQDAPEQTQHPCCPPAPRHCMGEMPRHLLEKFDANKDGQLDEQEKAAAKAEFEARKGSKPGCHGKPGDDKPGCHGKPGHGKRGHGKPGCHGKPGHGKHHQHFMEKFDANKDGQLDEQEKAAAKAEFEARHAEMKQKFMEKFDTNKDGQLDEQEKAAAKAEFEARKGDKPCNCCHGKKGPRHHRGPRH